ncbi:MAG: hypothetical protein AAFR76_04005 [Planctomycetota bacterium]
MIRCGIGAAAILAASLSHGQSFFLDGDSPGTGSLLGTTPLVTAFGTVSFAGEFRDDPSDPDLIAAGASGNVFDIDNSTSMASFSFDFDVQSFEFIFGGNDGVFEIRAFDIGGNLVDSFTQPDTDAGAFAGPVTLSGAGIRTVTWEDPGFSFAPIDNVTVTIPAPATAALIGAAGLAASRRRR